MKFTRKQLTVILVVSLAGSALAQAAKGQRLYDPSTELTVKGTVEEVGEITGKHGWNGVHFSLRAEKRSYDVHLGPSYYLVQNGFSFMRNDKIEVTGSKLGGTDTAIARFITKDGKALMLRDSHGIPK